MRKYEKTDPAIFFMKAKSLVNRVGVEKAKVYLEALNQIRQDLDVACYGIRNCSKGKNNNPQNFLTDKSVSHRMEGFIDNNKSLIDALKQEISKKTEPHDFVP